MSEPATKKKPSSTTPDWSLLPGELLDAIISKKLQNCFDVLHARSVCASWRSSIPFPDLMLTRPSYSLPSFAELPYLSDDEFCTLEKVPLFLFRVKTRPVLPSLYFLGGLIRDDHPSSQPRAQSSSSLKVKVHETLLNVASTLDFQILPLGHQYRVVGFDPRGGVTSSDYRGVAVLPRNEGKDFIVLLNYTKLLYIFRSDETDWFGLERFSDDTFYETVAFRGNFYVSFVTAGVFVLDPCSLEVTPLIPSPPLLHHPPITNFVRSGDDELFLVEKFYPFPEPTVIDFGLFNCRVSRLDEGAGKWVAVSDLGGRVFFIGHFGNVCCSGGELPDGCGVSGDSILFTNELGGVTFAFKYSVHTGDGIPGVWRLSREYRVSILSDSPVVALRVERQPVTPALDTSQ